MKMFLRTLSNQSKTERPKNLKKGSFVLWLPKRYEKANRVVLKVLRTENGFVFESCLVAAQAVLQGFLE